MILSVAERSPNKKHWGKGWRKKFTLPRSMYFLPSPLSEPTYEGIFTALLPFQLPKTVGESGSQNATSLLPEFKFHAIPVKVNSQGLAANLSWVSLGLLPLPVLSLAMPPLPSVTKPLAPFPSPSLKAVGSLLFNLHICVYSLHKNRVESVPGRQFLL